MVQVSPNDDMYPFLQTIHVHSKFTILFIFFLHMYIFFELDSYVIILEQQSCFGAA